MLTEKFHERIRSSIQKLQRHVDRFWYPPLTGLLAGVDNFVLVVPTDGILISSSMLIPKRWLSLALSVAIGSTLGAVALAAFVELQGFPWLIENFPTINQSQAWIWTEEFFQTHGLLVVFLVALAPVVQQPAVILAGLANTPLVELAVVIFVGRLIKFLIMAYLGSHAPSLLKKMWGLKGELKDAGVQLK